MGSSGDWDQRYAVSDSRGLFDPSPSELLTRYRQYFSAGMSALMLGDGEGRNGIWLAEQGLRVTSVDIAATALQRAQERAASRGVSLHTVCADVTTWTWPKQPFDIICSIFLHLPAAQRRPLHHAMWQHLKPGGLIVIEGFHTVQATLNSGGPRDSDLLLDEDGLREDFCGGQYSTEIVTLTRVTTQVQMNQHNQGDGAALHFIARRAADHQADNPAD